MSKNVYFILAVLFSLLLSCTKESENQITVDSGLIAYYPFNGNANDASGNNNNLTVKNATLTKDRFGNDMKAYHFDGINSLMEIPNLSYKDTLSLFSISLWLKADEIPEQSYLISLRSMENNNLAPHFMCIGKTSSNYISANGISKCTKTEYGTNCSTPLNIDTVSNLKGNWCHIVFGQKQVTNSYSKFNTFLYINGRKRVGNTNSIGPLSINYGGKVGCSIEGSYAFYNGDLDDIRIFSKALTEEKIQILYLAKD